MNKAPSAKAEKVSEESTKKAHLRNAEGGPGATVDDFLGVQFILDLASGKMLAFPDKLFKDPGQSGQLITNQRLGDLFYAGHSLFCLRGAKAMLWDGNGFIPMQQGDFAPSSKRTKHLTRYELTKFPCRLLITTAEKKQFDVTILSMTDDGGIDLEYRVATARTLNTPK